MPTPAQNKVNKSVNYKGAKALKTSLKEGKNAARRIARRYGVGTP